MNESERTAFLVEFLSGPRDGDVLTFEIDDVEIGRGEPAPRLPLPADTRVSPRHARLRLADGRVRIDDLGSEQGTFVNDERVDSSREVQETDVVRVGSTEFSCRRPHVQQVSAAALGAAFGAK
jgi:pSer/pThr/pTyr-binding forkhead associated (FHA) protein